MPGKEYRDNDRICFIRVRTNKAKKQAKKAKKLFFDLATKN